MIWKARIAEDKCVIIEAFVIDEMITAIAHLPPGLLPIAEDICEAHNQDLQYLNPDMQS